MSVFEEFIRSIPAGNDLVFQHKNGDIWAVQAQRCAATTPVTKRISSGNATVEELKAATAFLKNNGVARKETKGSAMAELAEAVTRSWDRMR